MALVKPIIFQIVGYKNSGKTTIVSDLIKKLKSDELNVVSIKHHGHGGKPEVVPNKDSSRQVDSGAIAAMVEGEGSLLLQAQKETWTLEEKIQLAGFFNPEIILIEGYKKGPFPKMVLLRNKDDLELLKIVSDIQVIIVWDEELKWQQDCLRIPLFHINDKFAIDWTMAYLKSLL